MIKRTLSRGGQPRKSAKPTSVTMVLTSGACRFDWLKWLWAKNLINSLETCIGAQNGVVQHIELPPTSALEIET